MIAEQFQVVHAQAAGLNVHKMEITVTVLLCSPQGASASRARYLRTVLRWKLARQAISVILHP